MNSNLPIIALLLILLMIFAFFGFLLIALASMYDKKKRAEEDSRDQAYKKALVILEEAKNKSLNIIKESNERAKRMIKETDLAVDESKDFVQEQLKSATTEFKDDVLKGAEDFKVELHKDALQTEQELRDKIAGEYLKVAAELESYKKSRLKEIDTKSLAVIEDVVKEFFAKTMKAEDHLDFIRQMLEKHKKPFELEA
ncbi:hypothetical protein COT50_01370 [candidate division WWE3 bacterium CG08_land_8_20_14_0_20_41_10]|uniref:Uncharacterized protein n=1 Tax=candidate division WWE3 bacterium CG08_land_8_20_14_0_20_41_10 TaxID=1975085 RepID=A0A2H0XEF8_UNCKA|nr:MAG: hypothetical protein COT50_01370 [candidate division WWE3 bacterium CG08_land_8_20_14_0_20_41_10]